MSFWDWWTQDLRDDSDKGLDWLVFGPRWRLYLIVLGFVAVVWFGLAMLVAAR